MGKKEGKIIIVVGGNFGSEGKGRHVEILTRHRTHGKIDVAVRTGAPNAGHTIYYNDKAYAMQTIPCSWIDPDCELVLGAGSQIEPDLLVKEIEMIKPYLNGRKIQIDYNAIIQDHSCMEAEQKLEMHGKMGSTAEGCGVALQRRIARDGSVVSVGQVMDDEERYPELFKIFEALPIEVSFTANHLNRQYDEGKTILLEGTQGAGLSLYHTPDYPKCTSRDTNAANWLAEAGLSPNLNTEIHMVVRAFPIRVAGLSGYLPKEISWPYFLRYTFADVKEEAIHELELKCEETEALAKKGEIIWNDIVTEAIKLMKPESAEIMRKYIEITTVTKKARRISKYDMDFYKHYMDINRPDVVVLQFVDYLDRDKTDKFKLANTYDLTDLKKDKLSETFGPRVNMLLKEFNDVGYPVDFLGIGKVNTIKLT